MAALEGGVGALATASGQAAQTLAITVIAQAGENIVSSSPAYGGTYNLFKVTLPRLGIDVRFGRGDSAAELEKLIDPHTRGSASRPSATRLNVPELRALADVAHRHGIPLIVDNTFAMGGFLCNPIAHSGLPFGSVPALQRPHPKEYSLFSTTSQAPSPCP